MNVRESFSHALKQGSLAQEVVAVIVDDRADGLDVLSVLPAEVCPDTTRRYLTQPER